MSLNIVLNYLKNLAVMPRLISRADPVEYYNFLGDDVVEGETEGFRDANKPLWLNLGYWQTARTYPDAARALAHELGVAANLGPSDRLLDVGFGFAEQDLYWVERFGVQSITGLNITPMQVERSRARVHRRGLDAQIDLRVGSATALPFADGSFTRVSALECAHHFQTRERFFEEALRVLTPGGRLATADVLPAPGHGALNTRAKLVLRRWASPYENYYDRNAYKQKLESLGFVNVQVRSISEWVFPHAVRYNELRRAGKPLDSVLPDLSAEEVQRTLKEWSFFALTDYVIFSADKPGALHGHGENALG